MTQECLVQVFEMYAATAIWILSTEKPASIFIQGKYIFQAGILFGNVFDAPVDQEISEICDMVNTSSRGK